MPLVIAVILGLTALVVVCFPLLGLEAAPEVAERADPLAEVADRETQAKRALREVDFDHRLGNLEDADYDALRERYEQRALDALRERYERERELDERIDQELAALRGGAPPTKAGKSRGQLSGKNARSAADRSRPESASQGPRPRRQRGV